MQHLFTSLMDRDRITHQLLTHTTSTDLARINSCASRSCSTFLTALPTETAHEIPNNQFILAIKHRLDLPPTNNQPTHCACKAQLTPQPSHYHSCTLLKRTANTTRHNIILNTLATLAREAGCTVYVEPNTHTHFSSYSLSSPTQPTQQTQPTRPTQPTQQTQQTYGNNARLRPDALFITSHGSVLVDVSVAHPLSPSYVHTASMHNLATAKAREKQKTTKYAQLAQKESSSFVPFVLESYGAIGKSALSFLRMLAREAETNHATSSHRHFLRHAKQCISAALQRGNAIIAQCGTAMTTQHQATGRATNL
jgi:hypothetical protein